MPTPGLRARSVLMLEAIAVAVSARPGRVLVLAALVAIAGVAAALASLRIHVDQDAMIASDLPHQQRWRDFAARHPLLAHPIVVVVDGAPGETGPAADALADAMRARDDLFSDVRAPERDPFFRRHGLLYLPPAELAELADRLVGAQPLLHALARDPTLHGLFGVLDDAVDWRERAPGEDLTRLLDAVAGEVARAREGRSGGAALADLVVGAPGPGAGEEDDTVLILARTSAGTEGLNPTRAAIDAVHALARERGLDAASGLRVRVTGDLALSADELALLGENALFTGVASFAAVTLILALGLRSARLVLALCATLAVGLAWTAGFAALAVGRLNMISVAFAVMSIGLGVDFGIHLVARFRERMQRGVPPRDALRSAVGGTGRSLLLCAATTAIAFYAFLPTDFVGLGEFGAISGTGILLSLIATLVVLPALLSALGARSPRRAPRRPGRLDALLELPQRRPRALLVGVALASAAALALLPGLRFSGNPLDLRAQDSESASAFRDLLERRESTTWSLQVVGREPADARRLAAELERLPAVARATTLADLVPAEQEPKLAVLEDLALMLGPLAPAEPRPDPEERVDALRDFADDLDCDDLDADGAVAASACRLRGALAGWLAALGDGPARDAALARFETRLLAPLRHRLEALDAALDAGPVAPATLPASVADLWRSDDGTWRVEIVPAGALEGDGDLEAFVDAVLALAPDATGVGVSVVEAERVVVRSLRVAFAIAALAIAAMLYARWRNAGDVGRALAPLALSALWILATATAFGMPLNFANVIVLPLILGIGIDSGVHMVDRDRSSAGRTALLRSSTAQAILLSALTTLASFGSLAFAPHPGMASMGRLLVLGVAYTLIANLVVLPALLALRRADSRQRSGARQLVGGLGHVRPGAGSR